MPNKQAVNSEVEIRNIKEGDNHLLAKIIRDTLTEFKANKPGTVFFDETTDHLYGLFQAERAAYFVAVIHNEIGGGAGIYPTDGLAPDTCELVKMYLTPGSRGKGIAKSLVGQCITAAKKYGFKKMYLETMPELIMAVSMYEKFGFRRLAGPMGNSGHNGCSLWMLKDLELVNDE